jgi:hypothetical protein
MINVHFQLLNQFQPILEIIFLFYGISSISGSSSPFISFRWKKKRGRMPGLQIHFTKKKNYKLMWHNMIRYEINLNFKKLNHIVSH